MHAAVATLLTGCYENRSCYRQCNERFSMSYIVGGLRKNSYCPLHFSAGLIRLLNTELGFGSYVCQFLRGTKETIPRYLRSVRGFYLHDSFTILLD